ncbi:MAG: hypothetical protein KGQ66_01150 [Acidobacteriota bacterium]|nr:hypothetical protein [Acidobacteriota bacterium]
MAGPAGPVAFGQGLVAVYGHMAQLAGVADPHVAEQILSDYVNFAPILIDRAPVALRPAATTYISAVAAYLRQLVAARLDPRRLPAGALAALGAPPVNAAYRELAGFSRSACRYPIGPSSAD